MRKRGQLGKDSVKKENTVEVCGQLKEAGENRARVVSGNAKLDVKCAKQSSRASGEIRPHAADKRTHRADGPKCGAVGLMDTSTDSEQERPCALHKGRISISWCKWQQYG